MKFLQEFTKLWIIFFAVYGGLYMLTELITSNSILSKLFLFSVTGSALIGASLGPKVAKLISK